MTIDPEPRAAPNSASPAGAAPRSPARAVFLLLALAALLFTIRVLAPPNLLDQDQERPASYVLDAVKNGNWICQRDWTGDITSKPPLWTWLAALFSVALGQVTIVTLYLPGALGAAGSALLVYFFGRRPFGERAALFGAVAAMLTTAGAKQFGLARTDGVFAFTVTLSAFLAYRSWTTGRGWTCFWLAAAAATLTKGPIGLVLSSFGLFAAVWERRARGPEADSAIATTAHAGNNALRRHIPGILLYVCFTAGWFALAYGEYGQALVDKMIGKELVGHAVTSSNRNLPGLLIWQQPLYYLSRALPWSLLAYYGLWRTWRRPAPNLQERQFERFLFCWFSAGLFLFSLAPHQRADLLWPLMPAGALIAGRELDRWSRQFDAWRFAAAYVACVALGLLGLSWYYFISQARQSVVRQTVALKNLADAIENRAGAGVPIVYVDAPMTLQIYLNTVHAPTSFDSAAALLRSDEPVVVAVTDVDRLEAQRLVHDPPWYRVLESRVHLRKRAASLISNRQELPRRNTSDTPRQR